MLAVPARVQWNRLKKKSPLAASTNSMFEFRALLHRSRPRARQHATADLDGLDGPAKTKPQPPRLLEDELVLGGDLFQHSLQWGLRAP